MANSVDPDETPRSAASHLGLHCLLRLVSLNTYGKYGSPNHLWHSVAYDLGVHWSEACLSENLRVNVVDFFLFLHKTCCGTSAKCIR